MMASKYEENHDEKIDDVDLEEIQEVFKFDSVQKIMERINSRTRKFSQQLKEYYAQGKNSPLSMALIFELMRRAVTRKDFRK